MKIPEFKRSRIQLMAGLSGIPNVFPNQGGGRSGAWICPICLRFPTLSVSFLCLLSLRCSDWCSCDNNCCCGMSIVVILMTLSQHSCCICQQGRLVALRLTATAFLIAVERLISWVLWRLTMMALIVSITIGDGFNCVHCNWQYCHRQLLLVATTSSSDAHIPFAAALFTSLLN